MSSCHACRSAVLLVESSVSLLGSMSTLETPLTGPSVRSSRRLRRLAEEDSAGLDAGAGGGGGGRGVAGCGIGREGAGGALSAVLGVGLSAERRSGWGPVVRNWTLRGPGAPTGLRHGGEPRRLSTGL